MTQDDIHAIDAALKEIMDDLCHDVRYAPKYGGEIILPDPEDDKTFVGGIFAYKDHISLEFSKGALFDDPNGLLEGKGKLRRHFKFSSVEDVTSKQVRSYLAQALKS